MSRRSKHQQELFRTVFIVFGIVSLSLGVIGIFLPVLPTTPFVLLSAFCFSKGSERLHRWLLSQPIFGPMIENWERYGVIPLKAKILATLMIVGGIGYPVLFVPVAVTVKVLMVLLGLIGLSYVLTRPSAPRTVRRTA